MSFLSKHLIDYFLTVFAASIIIFIVLEVLPGDPALHLAGVRGSEETLENIREQLGLNRPVVERYFTWIGDFVVGDWGNSYRYQTPVFDLVYSGIKLTFPLAVMTLIMVVIMGIGLAMIASLFHQKTADKTFTFFSQLGLSIPEFWLGMILILTIAINSSLFPEGGLLSMSDSTWIGFFKSLILPSIALAIPQICILFRYARAVFIETRNEGFVQAGLAHGFTESFVFRKYIFPMGMIPVTSLLSMQTVSLLTGTIIIEKVFDLPGLGHLLFISVENRDFIVIKTLVLLFVTIIIAMHFIVDIVNRYLDPRLRLTKTLSSFS